MMNVYIGDDVFMIPLSRWVRFRMFLLDHVKDEDIQKLKYVYAMMYGYILSVEVLDDAINQLQYFIDTYGKFEDILTPLKQILINAKQSGKEVGFGVY